MKEVDQNSFITQENLILFSDRSLFNASFKVTFVTLFYNYIILMVGVRLFPKIPDFLYCTYNNNRMGDLVCPKNKFVQIYAAQLFVLFFIFTLISCLMTYNGDRIYVSSSNIWTASKLIKLTLLRVLYYIQIVYQIVLLYLITSFKNQIKHSILCEEEIEERKECEIKFTNNNTFYIIFSMIVILTILFCMSFIIKDNSEIIDSLSLSPININKHKKITKKYINQHHLFFTIFYCDSDDLKVIVKTKTAFHYAINVKNKYLRHVFRGVIICHIFTLFIL